MLILRIDDCGWRPADKSNDTGLEYFKAWRSAFGFDDPQCDLPIYYGFIPTTVGESEIAWLNSNLHSNEHVAVHGWDHRKGAHVTATEMTVAARKLAIRGKPASAYIPPFNDYITKTIRGWREIGGRYFFGGFNGQDHLRGILPAQAEGCVHLPAIRDIYDRAGPLLQRLPSYEHIQAPLVVTLHATWDAGDLAALRPLRDYLLSTRDRQPVVGAEAVDGWKEKTTPTRRRFTAPHYLAYLWILNQLEKECPPWCSIMDFGARYSKLPAMMALCGHSVVAVDRDPKLWEYQNGICKDMGAKLACCQVMEDVAKYASEDSRTLPGVDAIVACWAIHHNELWHQRSIATALAKMLNPGGSLLVVSGYTTGESFHQGIDVRKDPQWVLNDKDHETLVIKPSEMEVVEKEYFWYEHATEKGEYCTTGSGREAYCSDSRANAICYHLRKSLSPTAS